MMRIYSVIYGQCSDGVRAKIETRSNHETIASDGDTIGLLENIKSVMANFQTSRKPVQSITDCKKTLLAYRQERGQTIPDFHKQSKELVDCYFDVCFFPHRCYCFADCIDEKDK